MQQLVPLLIQFTQVSSLLLQLLTVGRGEEGGGGEEGRREGRGGREGRAATESLHTEKEFRPRQLLSLSKVVDPVISATKDITCQSYRDCPSSLPVSFINLNELLPKLSAHLLTDEVLLFDQLHLHKNTTNLARSFTLRLIFSYHVRGRKTRLSGCELTCSSEIFARASS